MAEGMTRKEQAARVRWVADTIALNESLYDQATFCDARLRCETVGCIAGFTVWLLGSKDERRAYDLRALTPNQISTRATALLGLTFEQSSSLFCTRWGTPWVEADDGMEPTAQEAMEPTAQEAAHRLRHFARTGSVHK